MQATGERLEPALQMLEQVLCVEFDETKMVATGSGGSIYVYDLETSQLSTRIKGHRKDIEAMHLAPNTNHVITASWGKVRKTIPLLRSSERKA